MAQIKCENLCTGYNGRIIIEKLNFKVEKGDYLCIVGENGSGKTTLMRTLTGLIPAVSGSVIFDDDIAKTGLGYLPQQSETQRDFPASVWEIVLSGCSKNSGLFYSARQKKNAMENMEKMGITDFKNKKFSILSGGQQQRVLLARALCATDKILLLDEPVAGLDPSITEEMYTVIEKLNRDDNTTIVMISHDINQALKYSSHILHIGKKIFFGTTAEYINQFMNGGDKNE